MLVQQAHKEMQALRVLQGPEVTPAARVPQASTSDTKITATILYHLKVSVSFEDIIYIVSLKNFLEVVLCYSMYALYSFIA